METKNQINLGRKGNFILMRSDGRVEVYTGILLSISETHFLVRLNDSREVELLRTGVQKIEWLGLEKLG
jgi:hypothetical protein